MIGYVINLDERTDRLELFMKNNIPIDIHRFPAIKKEKGEDGCTLSHLTVLKLISELNIFPCVVFEDDCVLVNSWKIVEKAIEQLNAKDDVWDALWLGANLRTSLFKVTKNTYRLKNAYALHAVVYNSKSMVDFILNNHNTQSGKNLDIFYRNQVLNRFNCFITYPIVATQISDFSDIAKVDTNNYEELISNYNKFIK